jgi:hypothetical protein
LFTRDFANSNLQLDKFNIVSISYDPYYICDNFYLFPYNYLSEFSKLIKSNSYFIKKSLENIGCPINYILNEQTDNIAMLSFYKNIKTPYI